MGAQTKNHHVENLSWSAPPVRNNSVSQCYSIVADARILKAALIGRGKQQKILRAALVQAKARILGAALLLAEARILKAALPLVLEVAKRF